MLFRKDRRPDRYLRYAASSMMVLGVLVVLLALLVLVPIIAAFRSGAGGGVGGVGGLAWILVGLMLIYGLTGAGFIVASVFVRKRKRWAVILGIVLTSLALLFTTIGLIGNLLTAAGGGASGLGLIFSIVFVIAFAQLLVHLSRCFGIIRREEAEGGIDGRGFEPILEAETTST